MKPRVYTTAQALELLPGFTKWRLYRMEAEGRLTSVQPTGPRGARFWHATGIEELAHQLDPDANPKPRPNTRGENHWRRAGKESA